MALTERSAAIEDALLAALERWEALDRPPNRSRNRSGRRAELVSDGGYQLVDLEGFAPWSFMPASRQAWRSGGHGVGRHGDDGRACRPCSARMARVASKPSISGHLQVHQHQVKRVRLRAQPLQSPGGRCRPR